MGYFVVLLACMATPPGDCTRQPLRLPEIRNESACLIAGRLALREWRKAHPDMKVLEAKCASASEKGDA